MRAQIVRFWSRAGRSWSCLRWRFAVVAPDLGVCGGVIGSVMMNVPPGRACISTWTGSAWMSPRGSGGGDGGRRGSGKSTLLNLVAGLGKPTSGAITVGRQRRCGRAKTVLSLKSLTRSRQPSPAWTQRADLDDVTSPCSIWGTRATVMPMAAVTCSWPRPSCLRVWVSWRLRVWASFGRAPASICSGESPAACSSRSRSSQARGCVASAVVRRRSVGRVGPYYGRVKSPGYLRYPHIANDLVVFVAADDVWLAPLTGGRAWRFTTDEARAATPRLTPDGT
jgi:hypothetical protein